MSRVSCASTPPLSHVSLPPAPSSWAAPLFDDGGASETTPLSPSATAAAGPHTRARTPQTVPEIRM